MAGDHDDVYICHHESDKKFAQFLAENLRKKSLKVWEPDSDAPSGKGKALVNAQVCIVILSEESLQDKACEDAISLAYISDKPVFPVAIKDFPDLEKCLSFSMRLILAKLNWVFFIASSNSSGFPTESLPVLISSIKREIEAVSHRNKPQAGEIEGNLEGGSSQRAFYKRWNSVQDDVEQIDFWEENFGSAKEVTWIKFREAFLDVYEEQINEHITSTKTQWIVNILYGDVLELKKTVAKKMYDNFCGDASWGPDRFFLRLMDYAKGTIAMRGVFDMKSTVRLDAVQNLGQFRTAPVITSLMSLLDDKDANMRAVAAIALGKTEVRSKRVVTKLISKLTDEDRLVREATSLSLGHLKAKSAVPKLVERWRSDVISDVRQAAEIALEQVGSEESQDALRMTYLLSKEMAKLEAEEVS
ncbi:uncharacterized protein LOC100888669 [Strongylocentrotus purpuratus]|uniref:TIR domain-containing protein n=1 Tax=Strongylocentrotus purpuratus TaxID=7668 RepID=A0A7M7HI34_STRPU|nr:uncharacterized protein LOC100888669 [Strongylocentrotus purpuratus]XP_011669225.1 uncharacterized protein LOC100888669 [Strongylocentrotus purpuratus]|eukprot:XP_003730337.1 PREDICTED: uncharacterized protein LOC100888669 [Strongylocentrotus purpuratus]